MVSFDRKYFINFTKIYEPINVDTRQKLITTQLINKQFQYLNDSPKIIYIAMFLLYSFFRPKNT